MKDIVALIVDIGVGGAALHLTYSLNKAVKQLTRIVENLTQRVSALEGKGISVL